MVRCLGARLFCWFVVGRVFVLGLGTGAFLLWAGGRAVGFTVNTWPPLLCGGCVGVRPFCRGPGRVLGLLVVVVGCL